MTDSVAQHAGLPHAVFLHRLAGESPSSALEPRLGRAAFVALRLVDLLGPEYPTLHPDAFHYQYVATARCCRDLPPGATETSHLVGDVHDTLLQVGGEKMPPTDVVGARLRRARVYRKLNEFDAAEESYAEGGALAATIGDTHSELLSRIGRGYVVTARGNLAEAEHALRGVLGDAERLVDAAAQALAHQGISVVLNTAGQPSDAIPHAWRAFELYTDDVSRMRALGDLGTMLLTVGDAQSAERALGEILRRGATHEVLDNATIELMHCASYRRDRGGFERWRERCDARRESMPPNILVDYMFKAGIGRARFGQVDRAERLLASALRIADEAGLHEFTFRIERIQAGLRDCDCPETAAESDFRNDAVREVSVSLAHLQP